MRQTSTVTLAKLACAYSGVAWGLFWFPLRWLQDAGVAAHWIGAVFFAVQVALLFPIMVFRGRQLAAGGWDLIITTFFAGGAIAVYALAIVYTDVIRAMLLYYLTPIWSSLLALWVLKQPITLLRWVAIVLAFAGMLIIFGIDVGVPWPRNFGDWLGLASGVMWAVAAVRLHTDRSNHPLEITFGFVGWGFIICLALPLLPSAHAASVPDLSTITETLHWLIPVLAIVVIPGSFAAMWGARLVDPGIVGILFMTEIIVGTITVAIWAGEPFGARELIGILLISVAGLIESVWDLVKRSPTQPDHPG